MRRRVGGLVLAAAAVLAAGCGGDDDDDAGDSTPSGAAPSTSVDQASTVTNPRDATVLVTDPCAAFTAEQLAPYGIVKPGELDEKPSAGSPEQCFWPQADLYDNRLLFVLVMQRLQNLQDALGYLVVGGDDRIERVVIAGNPATLSQQLIGDRGCRARILLAPNSVLDLAYDQHRDATTDPCVAARELAEIAVGNLPPLS